MKKTETNPYVILLTLSGIATGLLVTVLFTMGQSKFAVQVAFWFFAAHAFLSSAIVLRDLSDISQFFLKTDRTRTMWTWYHRKPMLCIALGSIAAVVLIKFLVPDIFFTWPIVVLCGLCLLFLYSGYINPELMMRARQDNGRIVPVSEAKSFIEPDESVIVVDLEGHARAHPNSQVIRPHVAGGKPLGGEDVVMTYCGLTNLGVAIEPQIDGQRMQLRPMTQLHNNLIMVDAHTHEPIQQLWLQKESDRNAGRGGEMKQWPSFRMPFSKFCLAYPEGEVFLNEYRTPDTRHRFFGNPFLFVYDRVFDFLFDNTISQQETLEAPAFPTVVYDDKRLPSKEKVWAFNIGNDYVAYSVPFVREQGPINTEVGGQSVVVAFNEQYESLGVFYNKTGSPIADIDLYGNTAEDKMPRVETVKAGAYWIIWSHFFKNTAVNRV